MIARRRRFQSRASAMPSCIATAMERMLALAAKGARSERTYAACKTGGRIACGSRNLGRFGLVVVSRG
jgi:hypothetical protein